MSARTFNGSSYINCGNVTQLVSATQFTIVFRCFKGSNSDGIAITKGATVNRLAIERYTDGNWYLRIQNANTVIADATVGWGWYAATFDANLPSGSRGRFYRGNTLLTTFATETATSSTSEPMSIGIDAISGGTFYNSVGTQMSHVQVYSRCLDKGTGNELFNLMARPFDRPPGCVGHWLYGPLTGIAERDAMQNYPATWVGTPQYGTSTPPYVMNQAEVPTYGLGVA